MMYAVYLEHVYMQHRCLPEIVIKRWAYISNDCILMRLIPTIWQGDDGHDVDITFIFFAECKTPSTICEHNCSDCQIRVTWCNSCHNSENHLQNCLVLTAQDDIVQQISIVVMSLL